MPKTSSKWPRPTKDSADHVLRREGEIAGLWCELQVATPPKRGKGSWAVAFKTEEDIVQHVRVASDNTMFVPLIRPRTHSDLIVEVIYADRLDLLEFGLGILTVALLPPMLESNAPIALGAETLSFTGNTPWRAHNKKITLECLPTSRGAVEKRVAPLLNQSARWMLSAESRTIDVGEIGFTLTSQEQAMARQQIEQAAHLIGWADPRIEALLRRDSALIETRRRQASDQVKRAAKPSQNLSVRRTNLRVDSALLHCDEKQLPSTCSLSLDASLTQGPLTQAGDVFMYATASLVDADGELHSLRLSKSENKKHLSRGQRVRLRFSFSTTGGRFNPSMLRVLQKHLKTKSKARQEAFAQAFGFEEQSLTKPLYVRFFSEKANEGRPGLVYLNVRHEARSVDRDETPKLEPRP